VTPAPAVPTAEYLVMGLNDPANTTVACTKSPGATTTYIGVFDNHVITPSSSWFLEESGTMVTRMQDNQLLVSTSGKWLCSGWFYISSGVTFTGRAAFRLYGWGNTPTDYVYASEEKSVSSKVRFDIAPTIVNVTDTRGGYIRPSMSNVSDTVGIDFTIYNYYISYQFLGI